MAQLGVCVFRKDLFKSSEPFIADQAERLHADVIYVGEATFGPPPAGSSVIIRRTTVARKRAVLEARIAVDVVLVHFAVDILSAQKLAKALRVPLVAIIHGFDVTRTTASLLLSLRPNLLRLALQRTRVMKTPLLTLAVSEHIRDSALKRGARKDKVVVHHIGIPLDDVPGKRPLRDHDAQLPKRIIHVARLVEKKGTRDLVLAIALLRGAGHHVVLDVIGDGPERPHIEKTIKAENLAEYVKLWGTLEHPVVVSRINDSDIFCLPSKVASDGDSEGLGMVLLEAAAVETPIVSTPSGGITDFVKDGVTGVFVRESDPASIAHGIERILSDEEFGRRLANGARALLRQEFDIEKQNANLVKLLAKTLNAERAQLT